MRSILALTVVGMTLLAPLHGASACPSDKFDAEAELARIKSAYVSTTLPPDRQATLDGLVGKIDVQLSHLGLDGLRRHAQLRGEALSLLGAERIPRWPSEKIEALDRARDKDAASAAIEGARAEWTARRYGEATEKLDTAMRALGIRPIFYRC
jgi:hypothetical protein